MAKNIALGVDNFKDIIDDDCAFVDKTLLIKEFFQSGTKVTLVPRPRRFGKTMNLSMLRYFCEKQYQENRNRRAFPHACVPPNPPTEISHKYLFDGLKVSQHPEIMAHQGQYPVIFLTFKDIKVSTWEECYEKLCETITSEFARHEYLLPSIREYEQKNFIAVLNGSASRVAFEDSLKNLSKYLCAYHNKQVIILIDEYDTPIHEAVASKEKSYYTNVIYFIRNFMCAGLKGNENLHKGFITGILQVAKESIFSGMNNLAAFTLAAIGAAEKIKEGRTDDVLYTDKFGLLEDEVIDIFRQAEVPLDLHLIK